MGVVFFGLPMLCRLGLVLAVSLTLCNSARPESAPPIGSPSTRWQGSTCADQQSFSINPNSSSGVAICYYPGTASTVRFSFMSQASLSPSRLTWALISDTNTVLTTSSNYTSRGEGVFVVQNNFNWVALHLTCQNSHAACEGTADISNQGSSSAVRSTPYRIIGNDCSNVVADVPINAGGTKIFKCPNALPGGTVSLDVEVHITSFAFSWSSYSIIVLDDVNYNVWIRGGTPDCLNDDCDESYTVNSGSVVRSYLIHSDTSIQSYYFILQDNNSHGQLNYYFRVASSANADIPDLGSTMWNKFSDFPYTCSTGFWPSVLKVTQRLGTFYMLDAIGVTFIHLQKDSPAVWMIWDPSQQQYWYLTLDSMVTLSRPTFHLSDASQNNCSVTYAQASTHIESHQRGITQGGEMKKFTSADRVVSGGTTETPNPLDCYQHAQQRVNAGGYVLLSCPNPSPGESVTLNLNIAVVDGYHVWTTYYYLVLDDVNFNVWNRGGTPDCINDDCTTKYKPDDGDIYNVWSFKSDLATKAYYFIVQDNNFAGTPTYALTVAASDSADVYSLQDSAWSKVSDFPYQCSLNFWSPTITVTEQWGTMNQINNGPVGALRLDYNVPQWQFVDYSGALWVAWIYNASSLQNIKWSQLSDDSNPCTVSFVQQQSQL